MHHVLLLWALAGWAADPPEPEVRPAAQQYPLREWVDATGGRRARAAIVRIDGERIILRRSDGRLVSSPIANLSDRDRQYVASLLRPTTAARSGALADDHGGQPIAKIADGEATGAVESLAEGVAEAVETIQDLPRWLAPGQLGIGDDPTEAASTDNELPELVPAALVYARVTREFLEDYVERSVNRRKPVRRCVLGTRIVGQSHTRGRTRLMLLPSNEQLVANIVFEGTVRAQTRGYNGPVVLHSVSDSTFEAHKIIRLDDERALHVMPATIKAPTRLHTHSISTHLPRLRGRIARRIAWRRTNASHARAEEITEGYTADDVRHDFDERVNSSMSRVQRVFASKIPDLEEGTSPMPTDVRFRCRPEHFEMAILREDARPEEYALRPPPAKPGSNVSIRVHRTLFTSAIEDPKLLNDLTPLFTRLLEARPQQDGNENGTSKTSESGQPIAQNPDVKWQMESGWLMMDFAGLSDAGDPVQ